jgi:hypothetical protein
MPISVISSQNANTSFNNELVNCDATDPIILTILKDTFSTDNWFLVYRGGIGSVTLSPGSDVEFEYDTEFYNPVVSERYKTILAYFKTANRVILTNNLQLKTGVVIADATTIALLAYQYGALI